MTRDDGPDRESEFSSFEGELELARPTRAGKAGAGAGTGTGAGAGTGAGTGTGTGTGTGAGAGSGTGSGTGTAAGTAAGGGAGARPQGVRPAFRPVVAPPAKRSIIGKLFLLGLLAVGLYGGYYGYCRYQAADRSHVFSQSIQDLRQLLLRKMKTIRPADVEEVVQSAAAAAGVQVPPGSVAVSIEPLTSSSMSKLAAVAQMGLNMAAGISKHRAPRWVVGFRAELVATYGIARLPFEAERYTWLDDAQP